MIFLVNKIMEQSNEFTFTTMQPVQPGAYNGSATYLKMKI